MKVHTWHPAEELCGFPGGVEAILGRGQTIPAIIIVRSPDIINHMREERIDIEHYFAVWHVMTDDQDIQDCAHMHYGFQNHSFDLDTCR